MMIETLHRELADATNLVWQMQNTLTENGGKVTEEIESLATSLLYRVTVIAGYVARVREMLKEGLEP